MAAIYDVETGNEITAGLLGCDVCDEALQAAQRAADARGVDVELVDDDGRWLVHPAQEDGSREAADQLDSRAKGIIMIPGTQTAVAARDCVVIHDGVHRYPVERDDLDEQTEESLRAMTGDEYTEWCQDHRMDDRAGLVGSQGCIAYCEALTEAGAEEWSIG